MAVREKRASTVATLIKGGSSVLPTLDRDRYLATDLQHIREQLALPGQQQAGFLLFGDIRRRQPLH